MNKYFLIYIIVTNFDFTNQFKLTIAEYIKILIEL